MKTVMTVLTANFLKKNKLGSSFLKKLSTADTPLLSFAIEGHVLAERVEGTGENRLMNEGRYVISRSTSSLKKKTRELATMAR